MFLFYGHMCCMYVVDNNPILEHVTDLNIFRQD